MPLMRIHTEASSRELLKSKVSLQITTGTACVQSIDEAHNSPVTCFTTLEDASFPNNQALSRHWNTFSSQFHGTCLGPKN
jgi:hypothetical protein